MLRFSQTFCIKIFKAKNEKNKSLNDLNSFLHKSNIEKNRLNFCKRSCNILHVQNISSSKNRTKRALGPFNNYVDKMRGEGHSVLN